MASVYPPQVPQAAPVVPVYQPAVATSQDPLFEALVKYITQGPGPSSVTANDVQSIIDTHTAHPEGRAYLESIVAPAVEPPLKIWKNGLNVSGFLSTNLDSWTVDLRGSSPQGIPLAVYFTASGRGIFPFQVETFSGVTFFWDDFNNQATVYPTITVKGGRVVISIFEGEFRIPEALPIAEVSFPAGILKLPPVVTGKGTLTIAQ